MGIAKCIETDTKKIDKHNSRSESNDQLITYGQFVRESLPYSGNAVDPITKAKRLSLRQHFTDVGHPGFEYANIADELFGKLKNDLIVPAFWKLIDFVGQNDDNST